MMFTATHVNEFNQPIERTPFSHPYSYDGFVVWRGGKNEEANMTVYSDRLRQWDSAKFEKLSKKYCNPHSLSNQEPTLIEKFLQEYNNDPELKLILVMKYCNVSSGYPVWRFDYKSGQVDDK